jgi:hypothetical protein
MPPDTPDPHHRSETQSRQPARGIVDEHDQRAAWAAAFKPVVRTAVDLDQLAEPRAPLAQLKHPLCPPGFWFPLTERDQHLTNRFRRYLDPIQFQQFLRRQRRAKTRVPALQKHRDLGPPDIVQAAVRRAAALAGYQARVALLSPGTNQAFELADTDAQSFGGLTLA